ncbi:hypothetical protein LTR85_000148 [Meristemomyces frigidus]|nr:hypothetical protein LTR85_000148 [Meristemomyces frigidus]
MDLQKRAAQSEMPSSSVAEKARTVNHAKQDLHHLNATELEEVRAHILEVENRRTELGLINQSLSSLSAIELRDTKCHILQLQNQRSPLLRLPSELREEIFDLVALAEWRGCKPNDSTQPAPCFLRFHFVGMCLFKHACRSLRAECKDVFGRLKRLGMMVQHYRGHSLGWEALDAESFGKIRSMSVWKKPFATPLEARQMIQPDDGRHAWAERGNNGIIYFTTQVDVPPRVYRAAPGRANKAVPGSEQE